MEELKENPTHPQKPTMRLRDASLLTQSLAQALDPGPLTLEERGWIYETYMELARTEGWNECMDEGWKEHHEDYLQEDYFL